MGERIIDVSVAVAIYNIDKYLRKCLESLSRQDYDSCEFILVDDGSTDSSGAICDEYAKKDDRFIVIHKKNEGAVRARHTGVERARGKYVYLIDGDDWVDDGILSVLMSNQKKYHPDLLVSIISQSSGLEERRIDNSYVGLLVGEALASFQKEFISKGKLYHFGLSPSLCNKLLNRNRVLEIFKSIPSNITIGDDLAVTVPYVLGCGTIAFIDTDQLYHYQIRTDSLTHKYDPKLVDKVKNLKEYFDTLNLPPIISSQMDKYWAMITTMLIENQMPRGINGGERKKMVMSIYSIPGLLEAVSRVPHQDYSIRFKLLLYPYLKKNYTALVAAHNFDICVRRILSFLVKMKRKMKQRIKGIHQMKPME